MFDEYYFYKLMTICVFITLSWLLFWLNFNLFPFYIWLIYFLYTHTVLAKVVPAGTGPHSSWEHLTHEQPALSTTLSNLDAWGEPCGLGGACTPHLPVVSRQYGVVVKCFTSGQCGPGSIPGRCLLTCTWGDDSCASSRGTMETSAEVGTTPTVFKMSQRNLHFNNLT